MAQDCVQWEALILLALNVKFLLQQFGKTFIH
jgi:hypothetical protein